MPRAASGTFCDLPGQLLSDFRRLGIGWFKIYFQHIGDMASRWVWEWQLFAQSYQQGPGESACISLADAVLC